MTNLTTPTPPGPAARTGWRRLPVLAGAGLLTGTLLTGGTYALWDDAGAGAIGQITAGTLGIELVGEAVWDETSPDVEEPQTGLDPAAFLARPGDTVQITQDFSTELQGDNVMAVLSVDWADDGAAHLPENVRGTYVVLQEGHGPLTEPAGLGHSADLTTLSAGNDPRAETFTLQIDLTFEADGADRFGAHAAPVLADLGTLVLGLEQVRGEGAGR